jgi:hypothetical protein
VVPATATTAAAVPATGQGILVPAIATTAAAVPATGQGIFNVNPVGFGTPVGGFQIGQLVQVLRNSDRWTYGKIWDYAASGDVFAVMTKDGLKHMVERDCICDDVVVNPSDGSCAQQ